jgi:hypothetical protein
MQFQHEFWLQVPPTMQVIILMLAVFSSIVCYKALNNARVNATSRKVAGSSPDEVDFSIYLILPAALWAWGQLSL